MLTRGILWLAALAALAVTLRDTMPADPVGGGAPGDHTGEESLATLVRSAVDLRLPVGLANPNDPLAIQSHYPDESPLPAELQVLTMPPEQREACLRIDQLLGLARDRNLQEPAETAIEVEFGFRPVLILPVWDIQDAYGLATSGLFQLHLYQAYHANFSLFPGAAVFVGELPPAVQAFWPAYRRGLSPADQAAAAMTPHDPSLDDDFMEFFPTGLLDPLGDPPTAHHDGRPTDDSLRRYLNVLFAEPAKDQIGFALAPSVSAASAVPGGLVSWGEAAYLQQLQSLIYHPPAVRLARALRYQGLEERARARRVALCDDDPRLVAMALEELHLRGAPPAEVAAGAADILRSLPHSAPANFEVPGAEFGLNEVFLPLDACLAACALATPPDKLAAEIRSLTRTTLDADRIACVLDVGLDHSAADVRQAAMDGILDRLPEGFFDRLRAPIKPVLCATGGGPLPKVTLRPMKHWLPAERTWFFENLTARLHQELARGDAGRATSVLLEAVSVGECGEGPLWEAANGRLRSVGAAMFLHPHQWQALLETHHTSAIRTIARDLVHSSDPEARREGCRILLQWSFFESGDIKKDLGPLVGDPYTEDLIQSASELRSPLEGDGSLPGGFF